jgi:hypothetical protein
MDYQPTSNFGEDENGEQLAASHNILNMWKNYFYQILNVHSISGYVHRNTYS